MPGKAGRHPLRGSDRRLPDGSGGEGGGGRAGREARRWLPPVVMTQEELGGGLAILGRGLQEAAE